MNVQEIFKQLTVGAIFKPEVIFFIWTVQFGFCCTFLQFTDLFIEFQRKKVISDPNLKAEIKIENEEQGNTESNTISPKKKKEKIFSEEKQKLLHTEKVSCIKFYLKK